jgi:predicted flap endonuclease-1-like 5' DNA nuclease
MRGVGYATIEIVLLLLAAAIIGFLIAWILRRFLYNVDLGEYEERIRTEQTRRQAAEEELARSRKQGDNAAAEIAEIQARLADMESEASALTSDLGTARAAVSAKDGRIEQLESAMSGLEADVAAAESELGRREAAIEQLEADLAAADALRSEVERRGARIAELEVLVVERESPNTAEARTAELETSLTTTKLELSKAQRRITDLEDQIETTAPATVESGTGDATPAEAATEVPPQETAPLPAIPPSKDEAVARMAEIAARTAGDDSAIDDDLKKIHGVGPKLEQLLKSMGITSFRQVARFEAEDIAVVTAALDAFPGRIERDDWMSSAAEQHEEKYGEHP